MQRRADPLHLLPPRGVARADRGRSLKKKVTGVAYETIQLDDGTPAAPPADERGGRAAWRSRSAATCLEKERGGKGILLGGVPGVRRGRVAIIGGGVVGTNAAKIAIGMGARGHHPRHQPRTSSPTSTTSSRAASSTLYSDRETIARAVREADLVIGAVLIPGGKAPKLVTEALIARDGARARWSSTSRSTRAAASRPAVRPPTTIRPTGPRRGPLLRGQHAGRGRPDLDLRAHQRHPAPTRADRRPGLVEAIRQDKALARGLNTYDGSGHLRGRREGPGPAVRPAGAGDGLQEVTPACSPALRPECVKPRFRQSDDASPTSADI